MEAGSKDREAEGDEGERQGGRDARKAGKARDKKESWKERGDKKDAWKERRRKERPPEAEAAPRREAGENAASAQDKNQRGSALLSMLKANAPGTTRYSREELLSIGQLPASRVKPLGLNVIIDKENTASPLLLKPKVDKASRRRAAEGEEEEQENDARRERRDHAPRADRGGHSDGEEAAADRRRAGRRAGDRWNEERRASKGRHEDFAADAHAHGHAQGKAHGQGQAEGGWGKAEESQWDMPDANTGNQGDLADFTLGDIRKAEKSLSGGMSMKDYKASLRAGGTSERAAEAAPKGREDPFRVDGNAEGSFFVEEEEEEDEDVSRASRGFGKWFGSRTEPAAGLGAAAPWGAQPAAAHPMGTSRPSAPPHPAAGLPGSAPVAGDATASNPAGRSILSMLGRPEPTAGAGVDVGQAGVAGQEDRHAKLSVAELFHLAQGKELPPLPPSGTRRDDGAEGEGPERRAHREAMQMAQLMLAAAAKNQQPPVMPGGRFPGAAPGPCGAAPGFGFRGANAASEQLFQEAYAQAMLGMGQAPWASPVVPPGCPPFGGPRGYGPPQPYAPYGYAQGYPQMPRGPGYDASGLAQARQPPAGAQPGYSRLGQGGPAAEGAAVQRARAAAEKAAPAPPPAAQAAKLAAGSGGEEANDEDAGCSQS